MELSTKHPILADAAKHMPRLVFQRWLKHRRMAADAWFPKWRDEKNKSSRISMLDRAACFGAGLN